MDDSLKIYYELFAEKVSTEEIIRKWPNPLRGYEGEFIDGAIIDIGCGQSNFLLDYANLKRNIYAIDNDKDQLIYLKKRASEISENGLQNWQFMNLDFPKDNLPDDLYSIIILSNILHFFTIAECLKIEKIISDSSQKGTLIYISVHSYKHYKNDPSDPNNDEYFKHYFKVEDIANIFSTAKYDVVYQAQIEKEDSKSERVVINEWLEKLLDIEGIKGKERTLVKNDYLRNMSQADIQIILRKK